MRRIYRGIFIVWVALRYGLDELVLTSFQPIRGLSLLHYACAAVMIAGPAFGVPAINTLDPALICLVAGGGLSFLMILLSAPRRGG